MITIVQDALTVQRLWNGQTLHELVVAAMKPGVEYGDLGQIRHPLVDQLDGRQLARQMQRHQRHERAQVAEAIVIDQHGRRIACSSKNDTMPDDRRQLARQLLAEPFGQLQ